MGRRGYVPEDEIQFRGRQLELLTKAADEVEYLLSQGYPVKSTTTFVGNHYMFSERQRLALARSVSSIDCMKERSGKELLQGRANALPKTVYIDGFNSIITLEVALSGSPLLFCRDGAIRDLAGLRGTYRIIDKTQEAVNLLLGRLDYFNIADAVFYLDAPVSNSGRLSSLIRQCAQSYDVSICIEVIPDVDRVLEKLEGVISGDAIILNHCTSWLNIMPGIIKQIDPIWIIQL